MNALSSTPNIKRGLREVGLALGAGFVISASPFVPPRPWLKVAVFAAVAAAVFGYRYRSLAMEPEAAAEPGELGLRVSPLIVFCLLGIVILFQPTFYWMYTQWTLSVFLNTHGIFVPPLVAYLAWVVWQRDTSPEAASSPWGFAFIVPGLSLLVLDYSLRTRFISSVGFVMLLPGLSLLFLGTKRTLAMKIPLLISLFMIPLPYLASSVLFLREITTEGVVAVLRLLGIAVYTTGTVLHLAWGPFRVSEACSGLATFYSAIAIATVFTAFQPSTKRRIALLASAIPLAIASNVVRVLALVLLCKVFGNELLDTAVHEGSGAATFAVVFLILNRIASPRETRRAAS